MYRPEGHSSTLCHYLFVITQTSVRGSEVPSHLEPTICSPHHAVFDNKETVSRTYEEKNRNKQEEWVCPTRNTDSSTFVPLLMW